MRSFFLAVLVVFIWGLAIYYQSFGPEGEVVLLTLSIGAILYAIVEPRFPKDFFLKIAGKKRG